MSEPKDITNFAELSVEDTISVTIASAPSPDDIEFTLETVPGVTWWKGLELRSSSGSMIADVSTQDANHGPHGFAWPADDLIGGRLTFAKAKMWGRHTGMYDLENLTRFRGRSLQFLWERDNDKAGPVAGFVRDLGNAVNSAADAVAGAVETVTGTAAEAASTAIGAVGTAVADGIDAVGQATGEIPVVGDVVEGGLHWASTVVSAWTDLSATAVKAAGDVQGTVAAGIIRVVAGTVGGVLSRDERLVVKGLGDIATGVTGGAVVIGGKVIALGQAISFMQLGERPLSPAETEMLRRVYRGSVLLYNVRIVDGFAGIFSVNDSAFTLGNKIYMKNTVPADYALTLVHECCHVWQHQHLGTRYVSEAIWAQITQPGPPAGSWQQELKSGRFRWQDFNKEAQAYLLDRIFTDGIKNPASHPSAAHVLGEFYDDDPIGPNVLFKVDSTDFTPLARESVHFVRGAAWPVSRAHVSYAALGQTSIDQEPDLPPPVPNPA